jgi:hypothetical protein
VGEASVLRFKIKFQRFLIMDDLKPNINAEQLARTLTMLRESETPLLAVEIAGKLHLDGSHETQRRHVREIISELRNRAHWIVANLTSGYWLTTDPTLWADWCQNKMIDAKRIIGDAARRRQSALQDRNGQGMLFFPNKVM